MPTVKHLLPMCDYKALSSSKSAVHRQKRNAEKFGRTPEHIPVTKLSSVHVQLIAAVSPSYRLMTLLGLLNKQTNKQTNSLHAYLARNYYPALVCHYTTVYNILSFRIFNKICNIFVGKNQPDQGIKESFSQP